MKRACSFAAAAMCAAAFVVSSPARAEDPPPVRYPPSTVRPKLIVGGIAVTAIAYGAAFLGSEAASTYPGSLELKAPIVGPWIALAKNGCPPENSGCDAFVYLRGGLLILDGLLQTAGLAIVAEGILMKTEAVPLTPPPPSKPLAMFTWKPAPFVTPTSAGFGFVGTF
ncbi:MAG: hypothetical protein U0441_27430 [Polyangiaceae bacterium]